MQQDVFATLQGVSAMLFKLFDPPRHKATFQGNGTAPRCEQDRYVAKVPLLTVVNRQLTLASTLVLCRYLGMSEFDQKNLLKKWQAHYFTGSDNIGGYLTMESVWLVRKKVTMDVTQIAILFVENINWLERSHQ
jgi:hypothetical protein